MNVYTAIGRIGKDAVIRSTSGGNQVAGWSMAVDAGYGDNKKTLYDGGSFPDICDRLIATIAHAKLAKKAA